MNKKVKVILCVTLAAVLVLSTLLISGILGPRKIKVGVLVDEPMAYKDIDGEWVGFDVDFAKELFSRVKRVPEFIEVTASTCVQMLKKGEIDCYMSATYNSVGDFVCSDDYIASIQVVYHKKLDGVEVNSFDDLAKYHVGVLNNSKNQNTVKQYVPGVNVLEHATNKEIIEMLDIYDIEVALIDYMYADKLKKTSERSEDIVGIIYDYSNHFIVFNKKGNKMCEKVNEIIKVFKEEGYFEAWKSAYRMENYYQ